MCKPSFKSLWTGLVFLEAHMRASPLGHEWVGGYASRVPHSCGLILTSCVGGYPEGPTTSAVQLVKGRLAHCFAGLSVCVGLWLKRLLASVCAWSCLFHVHQGANFIVAVLYQITPIFLKFPFY